MYFEEYGDRRNHTIVMLHGAGFTQSFFNQYYLCRKYHIVVPHNLGNGMEWKRLYSLNKSVEETIRFIKSLNKNKISIVGFCLGAQLIIPILCREENLIDKAVMVSPWVYKSEKYLKKVIKVYKIKYPLLKVKFISRIHGKFLGLPKDINKRYAKQGSLVSKSNLIEMVNDGVYINKYKEFEEVNIPMLAVCGGKESNDLIISVKYLEKINPNCKAMILDKFNHDIPFKNPEIFSKILVDFLDN